MFCLALLGLLSASSAWVFPELMVGSGDRWVATFAALLGLLEYVNYYHRQLQHFDNWSDFRRLFQGKGFRISQLARDIRKLNDQMKS
jgi:hypothetical protein